MKLACFGRVGHKLGDSLSGRIATLFVAVAISTSSAYAVDWQGGNGNWNASNANPGWNGTFPNAVGDVANHPGATTSTTTQNAGPVTVGTISETNNSNNGWTITLSAGNGITLNQDGGGAGSATISNTNSDAGATTQLFINTGTLTLADNLLISSTSNSTNTDGAIRISSVIAGTGNITFSTASNTVTSSTLFPGTIRLQTGVNTFTGSSLVQKGAVTFNNAASFGLATNAITLGASGQGSASLISTAAFTWNAYPITVSSGSGGTLTLGSVSTGAVVIPGVVTLNGDVTLRAASTGGQTTNFTGKVTGAGNITTTGTTGGTGGVVTLGNTAGTSDFTGTVTVSTGVLLINNANSLGATSAGTTVVSGAQLRTNGTITVAEPITLNGTASDVGGDGALRVNATSLPTFTGQITLGSSGVLMFNNNTNATTPIVSGGITGTNTDLTISGATGGGNWTINTNPIATGTGSLTKAGPGTLTLAGANTYSGNTRSTAGTIAVNDSLALQNSTLDMNGADTGAVTFGVASATLGGLTGSRNLAMPTTELKVGNNNSSTTYSGQLSGVGSALTKIGTGTLTLQGNSSYSGNTTVSGGTLLANNATGSATGTGNVTVGNTATLGGTGAVSGSVTVQSGGTLSPGASIESLGSGAVTFSTSSTFKYEINTLAAVAAGADLLNATGSSLSIASGVSLLALDLNPNPNAISGPTYKYTMIAYSNGGNANYDPGTFAGYGELSVVTFTPGGKQFRIRYRDTAPGNNFAGELTTGGNNRFVTLTAVPELGSFITMGLVGCCAIGAVRFGRRFGLKALTL